MWCAMRAVVARRRALVGRLVAAQEEDQRAPPWTTRSARAGSTVAATPAPAPKPQAPALARPTAGAAPAAPALLAQPDHST